MPSVCLHTLVDILSKCAVGVSVNGDSVVIVDGNQVAELQVAGKGSSLRGDTLHVASISHEDVCVVVDELETWLVELGASLALSNGKTNGVGEALSEWAGGDLDTWGIVGLWVTRGPRVNMLKGVLGRFLTAFLLFAYSEVLEVIHGQVVTSQVKESILEHASVSVAGCGVNKKSNLIHKCSFCSSFLARHLQDLFQVLNLISCQIVREI